MKGWFFGTPGQKTLAVMGALRGNEIQQMYVCSQLIRQLDALEQAGALSADCGILVIPCANQFSMNVGRRFWAADNTDINRMFPGYDAGETTQRIAARIFAALQGYTYGVHVTSLYLRATAWGICASWKPATSPPRLPGTSACPTSPCAGPIPTTPPR